MQLILIEALLLLFLTVDNISSLEMSSPRKEDSDRLSRWKGRWTDNMIGWHKSDVHESLVNYGDLIIPPTRDETCSEGLRVLVPLCGKTLDMAYLCGLGAVEEVVGVDGIMLALEQFKEENPTLEIKLGEPSQEASKFQRLTGKKIRLLKGDFFDLKEEDVGLFDVVYDRASLVAIEPSLREYYVQVLKSVIKPGGKILMNSLDRRNGSSEAMSKGPPYSVPEEEVHRLFEGQDWIESVRLLEETDMISTPEAERFRNEGLTAMFEVTTLIQVKK